MKFIITVAITVAISVLMTTHALSTRLAIADEAERALIECGDLAKCRLTITAEVYDD